MDQPAANRMTPRRLWRLGAGVVVLGGLASPVFAQQAAAALHAQHAALQAQLRASPFGEPLLLRSRSDGHRVEGEVYAELAQPFQTVESSLRHPAGLCDLLLLHLNVRGCTPSVDAGAPRVTVRVGPKLTGGPGQEQDMSYAVRTEADAGRHLRVTLSAPEGPLSMRDVRMVFEAVPIDGQRSFVHLGYAYGYGTLARLAMGAYLATAGRDKIGFTVVGRDAQGRPTYVQGERAAAERNAMRYYLALLALRSGGQGQREEQVQARLKTWFALTERHAAQLHEYDLADYLREKRLDQARVAVAR